MSSLAVSWRLPLAPKGLRLVSGPRMGPCILEPVKAHPIPPRPGISPTFPFAASRPLPATEDSWLSRALVIGLGPWTIRLTTLV